MPASVYGEKDAEGEQGCNPDPHAEQKTKDPDRAANHVVSHGVPGCPVLVERVFHAGLILALQPLQCLQWVESRHFANVRFGWKADICSALKFA